MTASIFLIVIVIFFNYLFFQSFTIEYCTHFYTFIFMYEIPELRRIPNIAILFE